MKKFVFASVLLASVLSITSCSNDDEVMSDEVVPQKVASSLNVTARFVAENVTYKTTFDRTYEFLKLNLSGNTNVKVSISNTGDVSANIHFSDSDGNHIGQVSVPQGGAYYTYIFRGVSIGGILRATVTPSQSNGFNRVIGTMQATSW